jgi:Tfp pilus assembly protein FimT
MTSRGITFIELLFCLAISSVVLFLGISSLTPLRERYEYNEFINEIKSAILYAKLRALSDGYAYKLSAKTKNHNWSHGLVLARAKDSEMIVQWTNVFHYWDVKWIGVNKNEALLIAGTTQAMSNGHFIMTNKRTKEQTTLVVNKLGRVMQHP